MTSRQFAALLAATLVFRVWLAQAFPISGDEAYFIWWGLKPDWGFYDHPPMVGWWLAALLQLSDSEWWLRLPIILQPALLALAVRWSLPALVPSIEPERRDGIAALVLLAPVNVWNVFITTDTPLIFFSVLSGLAWLRAAQERPGDGMRWYLLAGVLLAGAVLSKYFVAFLGFAYLIDALRRRTPHALAGLVVAYACTVPALALMAGWNAEHCWPNFMFNFVNRHGDAGWSWKTPLLYALTLIYVLGPPTLWLAFKNRRWYDGGSAAHAVHDAHAATRSLGVLAWLPFVLFAGLSLVKQIGLHWLLSFVPFALIWVGLRLKPAGLHKIVAFFAVFAGLHVAAVLIVSRVPLEAWQTTRLYDGIVLSFEHQALARELEPYRKDWVLAMDGYSNAVTLGYNLRQYVIVFGPASSHARHDDLVTDFRQFDGKNILILRKSEPDRADYARFFKAVNVDSFEVRGARFWRVKGEGFNYVAYRDAVLAPVRQKYYRIPAWLPQTACYLCDRYFEGEACQP